MLTSTFCLPEARHGILERMEFLTLHELSKHFDLPERVLRYRFQQLRDTEKLLEPDDFRKEDYVDDQHFTWKLNPLSFMRETGLVPPPAVPSPSEPKPLDNQSESLVTNDSGFVNKPPQVVTKIAPETEAVGNQKPPHDISRELIDLLKEQLRIKDQQINSATDELRKVSDLNAKLVGQTVQQSTKIENLLRLTNGPAEPEPLVTKEPNFVNKAAADSGYQTPNESAANG